MARGRRRTPAHFLLCLWEHQAACEDHGVAVDDTEQVGVLCMQAIYWGAWEVGRENSTCRGKVVDTRNSLLEMRNDHMGRLRLLDISVAVDG